MYRLAQHIFLVEGAAGACLYDLTHRKLRQDILHWNRDSIPECRICEYRYACAPCLPDSVSDDPAAKPYFCTYDAANGIWNDPAAQIAAILGGTT